MLLIWYLCTFESNVSFVRAPAIGIYNLRLCWQSGSKACVPASFHWRQAFATNSRAAGLNDSNCNLSSCRTTPSALFIHECICIFMKASLTYSCSCLCIVWDMLAKFVPAKQERQPRKEGGTRATLTSASAANHSHLIILYKFDFKLDSQINTCTLHTLPYA